MVHNGIIENHTSLRTYLEREGIQCESDTDTEVLVQLIGLFHNGDIETAVRAALAEVRGTYGIALIARDQPEKLIVARKGSPLIIGVGEGEYIVASDATAYPHRDAEFIMNVHTRWDTAEDDASCRVWARDFYQATKPFATGGVYVNFISEDEDRVDGAYGSNYKRLAQVKAKYDGDNFFRLNQNIKP